MCVSVERRIWAKVMLPAGFIGLVLCAAVTSGCKRKPVASSTLSQTRAPTTAPLPLKPLQAAEPGVKLELHDAPATYLVIPRGVTAPSPVVVILGERAVELAAHCTQWAIALPPRHFVLCQSQAEGDAELGAHARDAERALKMAFRAVKRRFGAYVLGDSIALLGLSEAARVVPSLVRQSPAFFSRVALVEQGFEEWSAVDSARLGSIPTAKALLVCSSDQCRVQATRVTATLRASGTPTELRLMAPLEGPRASDVAAESPQAKLDRAKPNAGAPKPEVGNPLTLRDAWATWLSPARP